MTVSAVAYWTAYYIGTITSVIVQGASLFVSGMVIVFLIAGIIKILSRPQRKGGSMGEPYA